MMYRVDPDKISSPGGPIPTAPEDDSLAFKICSAIMAVAIIALVFYVSMYAVK